MEMVRSMTLRRERERRIAPNYIAVFAVIMQRMRTA